MRNFLPIVPAVFFLLISACGGETTKSESLASESSTARVGKAAVDCSGTKTKVAWTEGTYNEICRGGFKIWRQGNDYGTGVIATEISDQQQGDELGLYLNSSSFSSSYRSFCKSIGLMKSPRQKESDTERAKHSSLMDSIEAKIVVDDRVKRAGGEKASRIEQRNKRIGQLHSCPAQLELKSGRILKIDEDEKACTRLPGDSRPCPPPRKVTY
jgi:hypothetical protein